MNNTFRLNKKNNEKVKKTKIKNEKNYTERYHKSNDIHSKDNSLNYLNKQFSISRNNNLKMKNQQNIILNYNYNNYKIIKKNISLNSDYMIKTLLTKNKYKKSIDFSDKSLINQSSIKKKELSIENDKLNKTQRTKKYNTKIKKNRFINNSCYNVRNIIKSSSDIRKDNNKKINIRNINSSILSSKIKKIINSTLLSKKQNYKKNICKEINYSNHKGNKIDSNYMEHKTKSRNNKKNIGNSNKSNSLDNKKNNGLISNSMSMNKKTFSNKKNIIKKNNIINNKLKKYNDKINFISNYAQIYLRKNFFEKENIKNRIIYNKSLTRLTQLKK